MATEKLIAYHDNSKGEYRPADCDRIREISWRISFLLGAASKYMAADGGFLPTEGETQGLIFLTQDIFDSLNAYADDLQEIEFPKAAKGAGHE